MLGCSVLTACRFFYPDAVMLAVKRKFIFQYTV